METGNKEVGCQLIPCWRTGLGTQICTPDLARSAGTPWGSLASLWSTGPRELELELG